MEGWVLGRNSIVRDSLKGMNKAELLYSRSGPEQKDGTKDPILRVNKTALVVALE